MDVAEGSATSDLFARMADEIAAKVLERLAQTPTVQPRLLDVEQAARYLSRSEEAVKQLISRGRIPVTMIDGKRQVDRLALDKLIQDKTFYQ